MNTNQVILRCEDKQEAVVFTKYKFKTPVYHSDGNVSIDKDVSYEISVEDSYIGGNYKGLFGRIKRAWRAFIDKPVVYTGIDCEDRDEMVRFLENCLDIVQNEGLVEDVSMQNSLYCEETVEKFVSRLYEEDEK